MKIDLLLFDELENASDNNEFGIGNSNNDRQPEMAAATGEYR